MARMTVSEASKRFGVERSTIHGWIQLGWLETEKEGGIHLIDPDRMQWVVDNVDELRADAVRRRSEAARQAWEQKRKRTDRQCPPHLLTALHLFIRAVASGIDFSDFRDPHIGNPFALAAERTILVESNEELAGAHARECMTEEEVRRMRWTGRRWVA